jgi:hypothetical protein
MNRYSRPSRTPSMLSESVHHRLNAYCLAASAAGVGLLALAQPAEAKIVYTAANVRIGRVRYHPYYLDINHDGTADFMFSFNGEEGEYWLAVCPPLPKGSKCTSAINSNSANEVWGYKGNVFGWASALRRGVNIGPDRKHFIPNNVDMATMRCGSGTCNPPRGPWAIDYPRSRYLGLKFVIGGGIHYGWARIQVPSPFDFNATLTGYAYETIHNKPIIAGKTHGKDGLAVQPASLGALAAGSSALSTRRHNQGASK